VLLLNRCKLRLNSRLASRGSGNLELFGAAQAKKTTGHYDFLRDRYTSLARGYVKEKLEKNKRLAYRGWERLPCCCPWCGRVISRTGLSLGLRAGGS
jgi:hypothetical protein